MVSQSSTGDGLPIDVECIVIGAGVAGAGSLFARFSLPLLLLLLLLLLLFSSHINHMMTSGFDVCTLCQPRRCILRRKVST